MSSHTTPTPAQITLSYLERTHLEAVVRRATASQRDVFRSRIVLLAARSYNNTQIARQLSCTRKTVRKWRNRYADSGRAGLVDKPRPGRPRIYPDSTRALITALACELPANRQLPLSRLSSADIHAQATHEVNPCPARSTIAAWLKQAAIKPWTVASWVTPRDPQFKQKAGRVCDLYTGKWEDEPLTDRDVIICADEKTGIQARSRRKTPPGPGKSVRIGHQYDRHGTTIYQAAFIAGTGGVIGHCVDRNTRANFETLVEKVMADPICRSADRVFWIVDNGSAHHPATFRWWLKKQYPTAIGLHLPTGASWLNQIELYFSVLTRKSLTGESFHSVDAVENRITEFGELWNSDPEPFEWTYTRNDLTRLLERLPTIE
ncbi:IS630 family transposase [Saliphagus infecundisoli]|uniref:IS630 family transposase n=1 Tax=Saliphagus infecundisoli TaxID=1849069 RepID=A0ABD5QAQ0_9EURY|nr:IS630 family transposase [Saliphagus infecundisoli]